MNLFITGASGYIGSAVAAALIERGHRVRGLARSDRAAEIVRGVGASPVAGSLTDLDVLEAEAAAGDGVIHTAADPGSSRADIDKAAVEAMLSAMRGGLFVTTSGAPRARSSRTPVVESDVAPLGGPLDWLAHAEDRVLKATTARGIVVRPPIVYGDGGGPLARMAQSASAGGAYVIDGGENCWSTVHVRDLARAYVLLAESEARGVFHVAEREPEPMLGLWRAIAEAASVQLQPRTLAEAIEADGPLAAFLAMDAALDATRLGTLGWTPEIGASMGGIRGALASGNALP
ncbi:MAG: NAD-dependent epimerase/dehydratase family protein [Nannocystales bacterium]